MNENFEKTYVFEASWEVCNKVGGINTVVKTKIRYAVEGFQDRYFLIGPDIGHNPEFQERNEELWDRIRPELERRNLRCRFGRWDVPGNPRVILVNHNNKYEPDKLLFQLWQDFGVDSMAGGWDYIEPVIFSTAYGEVIEVLYRTVVSEDESAIAQFHEWMSAAGMLYLKKQVPEIATVFTSHATMLGRALSARGIDIYSKFAEIIPQETAAKVHVAAKHSMETVAARESDCFTTVSEITARESSYFLNRRPRVVLPNGINIEDIPDYSRGGEPVAGIRDRLIGFARLFLQDDGLPENTKFLIISGRYEFHNKGIDLFLETMARINEELKEFRSGVRVVVLLCIIGGHFGVSKDVQHVMQGEPLQLSGIAKICTHQLQEPQRDPIWNKCKELNLLNDAGDPVNVVFMPVYLDGFDGLLNMTYFEVITGCDLCAFPSYYEPWGYTPLEGAAFSVPTVTTDLSGFGMWIIREFGPDEGGVFLLKRNEKTYEDIRKSFVELVRDYLNFSSGQVQEQKMRARYIAERASWENFYPFYLQAYRMALRNAGDRMFSLDTSAYSREVSYAGTDSMHPRFRQFSVSAEIPKKIGMLRDLAYNLLWTWNEEVRDLFLRLDPDLWEQVDHNPVEMLERISQERLREIAEEPEYQEHYKKVVSTVQDLLSEGVSEFEERPALSVERPVAYFSTEYGLHEILPIYSGGLGILSADHLKSASNLNVPMVGIGLLYKNGYFTQQIDREGRQITFYPENDFSRLPVRIVEKKKGEPLRIAVDLPGRQLFAQVWKVMVGRVPLYLLDTAVPENSSQDREITSRLYGADQRLRIEQEIMLGIGGIRLLEALDIQPALFHLNEGHSAFLLLERIRQYMKVRGLTFYEAREMVKATSLFTTHSPVEAANERFDESLMKHYFSAFVQQLGISWETFWELGREEPGEEKPFMMPVLAFKLCCAANAVSRLHGQVARNMWQNVWSGFDQGEVPIQSITNGIHLQSWIADEMKRLYREQAGIECNGHDIDREPWDRVEQIPDRLFWETHRELKSRMVDYCRDIMTRNFERQGLSPAVIKKKMTAIDADALIIGFGRRFAAYKRAALVFSDPERLSRIINSFDKPVKIIFAGKAHPNDEEGKGILKTVYDMTRDERFLESVFFLENYDIETAKRLLQGVDLWLNVPVRPLEASGTSGMKGIINGVLNFSVLDGWWDEAYDGENGWAIGDGSEYANREMQDLIDSRSLYDVLEYEIIPAYYTRDDDDVPREWVAAMKRSVKSLVPRYNTHRMLREYYERMYLPVARRAQTLSGNNYERVKLLTDWKLKIASRFSTVHVKWLTVRGLRGDSLRVGDRFEIEMGLDMGKLSGDEIRAEIIIERSNGRDRTEQELVVVPMNLTRHDTEKNEALYAGVYEATVPGRFVYGVRVLPDHPQLLLYQELGLVHWA
ncbi:MAG: alpha-glucan family phosphorylase [Deltaproteobacteria bacterium]|nr:alpha-glucan family phosphorylase [Deltaproteobacteria bacterium]